MQKLLLITEEINKNSEKNGFFHGVILDMLENFSSVTILALRVGENNLSTNPKVKILKLEKSGKLSKALELIKIIFSERKNYDKVLVHRNPEYVVVGGIFWRLLGKQVGLYYSHTHSDWKLKLATLFSNKVYSTNENTFPLSTKKLSAVQSVVVIR